MLKILIVDDEQIVRDGLVFTFEGGRYEIDIVGTADNGIEAVPVIEQHKPDIVLTDIKMPGMDGLELAQWIREHYPEIKVIFLTGYSDFDYARNALKLEVSDYLLKPVDEDELFKILEKIEKKITCENTIRQEYAKASSVLDTEMPYLREKFIADVLKRKIPLHTAVSKAGYFDINLSGDYNVVALIELFEVNSVSLLKTEAADVIKMRLKTIIDKEFACFNNKYVFNEEQKTVGLLLNIENSSEDCGALYDKILEKLDSLRKSTINEICNIVIGVSSMRKGVENLPECHDEALKALDGGECIGKRFSSIVDDVKEYILNNYMEDISLKTLSGMFYVSAAYLSSIFSTGAGESLIGYLTETRMKKAKELLYNTGLNIRSISKKVGYDDEKYFCRVFKKKEGISPQEYRKISRDKKSPL